ncbi:cytochrome c biogenesis CcdA family protein [Serpentinicella alkaliphila]|uniref:Thiol:disulfide interchange protein DsbD n=1 Tax=Serpentinicella alkaliphila TaxID=1734049 RepID=A0A4R2TVK1_9FIRM|nr:cytochrome c biogenesis protein CcdA [Serpentinicella alkaliphila]TCQ07921.1 thiol:disulfide interchange protein DsbD [Serpentinicella alkaliphila]
MFEVFFKEIIPQAIASKSLIIILIIFAGGIITSLSPCILSMLPVMIGYIAGYGDNSAKTKGFALSTTFVLGMSTTFAILGLVAASLGIVFGQISSVWYYILATVAIIMGLNLLGVISFNIPGIKKMPVVLTGYLGAYVMGLFFGLAASPCATPVLAVIMTYVALEGELVFGALLLFIYGIGHGLPLILAGTFTVLLKKLPKLERYTQYINYFSGGILILLGLWLLIRVSW